VDRGNELVHTPRPDELAAEVAQLRSEVQRLLDELSVRLSQVTRLPRRAARFVRAHPVVTLSLVALFVAGAIAVRRR
jgi:hypothetical protein